jgi:hypothetical protein
VRPHFAKPVPQLQQHQQEVSDEDGAAVADTQQPDQEKTASNDAFSTDTESEYASDDSHSRRKPKSQKKPPKGTSTALPDVAKIGKEGPVKTAARKIKATANANYRRLKIKSKGGNGGKGKFGRRR